VTRIFYLFLLASMAAFSSRSGAAEVVVHRSLSQQELTLGVARLLFTMRLLRWPDGTRVRVFVLHDDAPLHREFAKQSLDLYPRQLRRVWDRHLFSGSGAVPVSVNSVDEMLKRVSETPGAIGYLPDGFADESVRVIHVK
jgi:hypothetical protein